MLQAMSTLHLVPDDLQKLYHVREWRNATGILHTACPKEWEEIIGILRKFRLLRSEVKAAGKNRSPISRQLDGAFYALGWEEKKFNTSIKLDDKEYESPTHKIDCFKGRVALELEWNNKDPFFDRDLNNFRLLFDLRAIDVGVIITRASELQAIFKSLGKGSSYGNSTTHHEKLWPRLDGGGGGGCPVLVFAITPELYVDDGDPTPATIEAMGETDEDEDAEA
ncbi:BglII/BstYI family type II restriction endonuclease [Methylorubrum extorquens]|uniref:BglII/BstYI family type II restriction endonuclease n=1 Tax=Methylorubrum extorquens TaxID=408 RepID=UPI0022389EDE|nr:BglII/BstYI family type II restriction endonuclease [Methylorubrum extorquens]UYW28218.1 BglII/BstYI family type II restriction endonuclease [Methylorubrum extorquens]